MHRLLVFVRAHLLAHPLRRRQKVWTHAGTAAALAGVVALCSSPAVAAPATSHSAAAVRGSTPLRTPVPTKRPAPTAAPSARPSASAVPSTIPSAAPSSAAPGGRGAATASSHPTVPVAPNTAVPAPPAVVPVPTPTPAPHRHADWGVYVPQFPGDISAVDAAERSAGRHADIVMWFVHWGGPWSAFNATDVRAVLGRGSTPMITWMSDDPSASGYPSPSSQTAYTAAAIVSGRYDAYIRSWAAGLRDAGAPVLLRFDHEMNGSWYTWSPGVNGQSAQDYVAAWRHVHDLFVAVGASNVQWVWSPNIAFAGSTPLAGLYPGDAYVDRVAVDGYNWGPSDQWHSWQSFAQLFDATLAQVGAITARPLMLGEIASTERGGDKAAWITDFFANLVQRSAITGFVWFDANKETDWRLDSSAATQSAFARGLASVT